MSLNNKVCVFGDSILHGIQLRDSDKRYVIDNHIDIEKLESDYMIEIKNYSKFGCTIGKGERLIDNALQKGLKCSAVILEYGGNDCDFDWADIANSPDTEHLPKTPLDSFCEIYRSIIKKLVSHGISPIATTLPPIISYKYFNWFCSDKLNRENILKWLGDIENIAHYQEKYSRAIEVIAKDEKIPLIDLRGAFLRKRRVEDYICSDGIHPNTKGQELMSDEFYLFASKRLHKQAV